MTPADYDAVHARTLELIGERLIDGAYYCPDSPDRTSTHRKPATGMVHDAAREHALDLRRSWFVGDKDIDVACGRAAGTRTVLVLTGRGDHSHGANADFVARDLADAADFILKNTDATRR
jgi:D-glycero-D-manno-heptose 1,7-bisphosphate phosphatase